MKRRMESIDHQPKLITIRPKIQHNDYDGYIVSGGSSVMCVSVKCVCIAQHQHSVILTHKVRDKMLRDNFILLLKGSSTTGVRVV